MPAAKFRYLISPVLAAGDHFLVSGPRSGPAKPSRSDGSAGHPARGGRELDNREPGKMAEPGSLGLPCEPTVVASPAACGPARGGRPPIQADMIVPGSGPADVQVALVEVASEVFRLGGVARGWRRGRLNCWPRRWAAALVGEAQWPKATTWSRRLGAGVTCVTRRE
jgi:hypothetical protein